MRGWHDIAYLAKTRNLNGGFVVKSTAGLPFLLVEGDRVAFVPPRLDLLREATVDSVELLDDWSALVHFAEIKDKSLADELVGCHCLVQLSEEELARFYELPQSWEGWSVVDVQFGHLGTVEGLIENPTQSLLKVAKAQAREDGASQKDDVLLIPVVDEFVIDVDVDARMVRTSVPKGLLDL